MNPSTTELLKEMLSQDLTKVESELAQSVKKIQEELSKMGFDKKPEYTIPQADTIGKGYYSLYYNKK